MIGAMMVATGKWKGEGVFNMEDFDPAPFMDALNLYGLPWQEVFEPVQEV
jgi:saccharopine dehydrogenase (NAD+, L-lysine-forming)